MGRVLKERQSARYRIRRFQRVPLFSLSLPLILSLFPPLSPSSHSSLTRRHTRVSRIAERSAMVSAKLMKNDKDRGVVQLLAECTSWEVMATQLKGSDTRSDALDNILAMCSNRTSFFSPLFACFPSSLPLSLVCFASSDGQCRNSQVTSQTDSSAPSCLPRNAHSKRDLQRTWRSVWTCGASW